MSLVQGELVIHGNETPQRHDVTAHVICLSVDMAWCIIVARVTKYS